MRIYLPVFLLHFAFYILHYSFLSLSLSPSP